MKSGHLVEQEAGRTVLETTIAELRVEIADRNETVETLERTVRSFQTILDSLSDSVAIHDLEGRILFVNSVLCDYLGVDRSELLGSGLDRTPGPFFAARTPQEVDQLREEQGFRTFATLRRADDGTSIPVEVTTRLIEVNGDEVVLSCGRNTQERSQVERVIEMSPVVAFVWRNELGWPVQYVSDNVKKLCGYAAGAFRSGGVSYSEIIHPDDLERVSAEVDEACADTSLESYSHAPYRIVTKSGETRWVEDRTICLRDEHGQVTHFQGILLDISGRKKAETLHTRLMAAIEQASETIVITDASGVIQYVNPAFERITGFSREEAIGRDPKVLASGKHGPAFYRDLWGTITSGSVWAGHFINKRKDGSLYEEDATISPVRSEEGEITAFVAVKRDVTEQIDLERQLNQANKLEAIGQLAAGIAHEINTPTQFVGDNVRFLNDAFSDLLDPLKLLAGIVARDDPRPSSAEAALLKTAVEEADIEYMLEEIPTAITQSLEGVGRTAEIVRAMKAFSHPAQDKRLADLNQAINTTITVARNEWKYVADVTQDFDEDLPQVPCYEGDFNQVILNMIVNASHAISDVVNGGEGGKGTITVQTRALENEVEIRVSDTGTGIPPEVVDRIFDPFFTTKALGKGTGQGLSLAHATIVKKHGGTLNVETEVGKGSTFVIRLPLADD